jgi:hypothetical protein
MRTYLTSALSVGYASSAGSANSVAYSNVSGRPTVYYQSSQPTGSVNGDIWIVP